MLRVNLLPEYVGQRRLSRKLTVGFSCMFVMIVGGMLTFVFAVQVPSVNNKKSQADQAEAGKKITDDLLAAAETTTSKAQPTKAKLTYVADVHAYNRSWAELYDQLARYTDPEMIYTSAQVSGQTMQIHAYASSIKEVGKYLTAIYNEPDFSTVSIDKLPGYPEAVVKKYYLRGHLVGIGAAPTAAGVGGTTADGAGGYPGAAGGGYPGAGGGGYPGAAGGGGGYPGAGGGGYPGAGGAGGGGGYGGTTTLGNGYKENLSTVTDILADELNPMASPLAKTKQIRNALRELVVKEEPKGFEINITATLKKSFVPPAPPGTGGGATTTGGGGYPGAPGGGYPGAPGGGYPGSPGGGYPGAPGGGYPGASRPTGA